jgi:hypothetical protein
VTVWFDVTAAALRSPPELIVAADVGLSENEALTVFDEPLLYKAVAV